MEPTNGPADPVVDALNAALQFARDLPVASSTLFVNSIRIAIRAHLTSTNARRQGLTRWQERRAKEFLIANAAGDDVSVVNAAACKLSRSYFIKAFKNTTGQTPHRWLTNYRIEKTKELLLGPRSIAEIALECGFSDQSHLTRVFAQTVGVPPGYWRREYRDVTNALTPPVHTNKLSRPLSPGRRAI